MNTADYLLQAGEDTAPAILSKGAWATYSDLQVASARLAGELLAVGVRAGDRVGLLGENSLFWIAAYLATLKICAISVPLPTVATPEDLGRKERFVECKAVFVEKRSYRKFSSAFRNDLTIIFDDILQQDGPSWWEPAPANFDLNTEAALMLTSGTTARPRAVRITHRNIQANTDSIVEYLDLTKFRPHIGSAPLLLLFRNFSSAHAFTSRRVISVVQHFRLSGNCIGYAEFS